MSKEGRIRSVAVVGAGAAGIVLFACDIDHYYLLTNMAEYRGCHGSGFESRELFREDPSL